MTWEISSLNYTATSCSHHDYELSHLRSRIHFIVPPFEAQVETTRHRCEYTLTYCKSTKLLACLQHESPSFHTFQTILSFFCLMSKIRRYLWWYWQAVQEQVQEPYEELLSHHYIKISVLPLSWSRCMPCLADRFGLCSWRKWPTETGGSFSSQSFFIFTSKLLRVCNVLRRCRFSELRLIDHTLILTRLGSSFHLPTWPIKRGPTLGDGLIYSLFGAGPT